MTDGGAYLVKRPETAAVEFFGRGTDGAVVSGAVDIDELSFPTAVEDVLPYPLGLKVGDAEFFADLSDQGLLRGLAIVEVAAHGGVPLAGLDVFPGGTLLEVDLTLGVEHMEMDDGVQQSGAVVALAPCGCTDHSALLVDNRKTFGFIVLH